MSDCMKAVAAFDPAVARLIEQEEDRQSRVIRLIASENYTSNAVMAAMGSVFTNKYAEGYYKKRYYHGQEFVDELEMLAITRGKDLFGAEHLNVQPYSGSPANLAAYLALLQPGDTILGMSLPAGGHLTHGWPVSASGIFYRGVSYGINRDTECLDYDDILRIARQERPRLIIAGASAYSRTIDFARFRQIADDVGAYLVADMAHISGLVAGGVHPSPVPHADIVTSTTHKTLRGPRGGLIMSRQLFAQAVDKAVFPGVQGGPHVHAIAALAVAFKEALEPSFKRYATQIVANAKHLGASLASMGYRLVSGGTDNHLLLVDLTPKGIFGKTVAEALNQAGIILNANSIPFDSRKPFDPSGVRLGTAAVTTRGMKEPEMEKIAEWFDRVVRAHDTPDALAAIRKEVEELTSQFPLFDTGDQAALASHSAP